MSKTKLKFISEATTENVIEWLNDPTEGEEELLSLTLSKGTELHQLIKKTQKKRPELFDESFRLNPDGSIFCHIPRSWVSIQVPRKERTDKQKRTAENLKRG